MLKLPLVGRDGGSSGIIRKVRAVPLRLRYMFLLALICAASFFLLTIGKGTDIFLDTEKIPAFSGDTHYYVDDLSDARFTIRTKGCSIPVMQLNDSTLTAIFSEGLLSPKPCSDNNTYLLSSNRSHIWINWDHLQHNRSFYNLSKDMEISCCYKPFFRPNSVKDITSTSVDDRVQYKECSNFTNHIKVTDEFVRVMCFSKYKAIHDQFFLFAIKKPFQSNYDRKTLKNTSAYNVIVMGIDSVSRLNFQRTMPKTFAYMKNKGAIDMLGYNKVADNTTPNLVPMLLGVYEPELNKTCWLNTRSTFDNCRFVWETFKEQGYYTAYGEDTAGHCFAYYYYNGFLRTPTDYYLHTFQKEAQSQVGGNKDYIYWMCMGGKYFYRVYLDYIDDLTTTLQSSKLFGFFWEASISHDNPKYPTVMDDSYKALLRNMEAKGYLENTVLILVTDHGMRSGKIRKTKQGYLEERLPLLLVLTPQSFRNTYTRAYENLKTNSHRLVTPFDVHETLTHLAKLHSLSNEEIEKKTIFPYYQNRGISLFLPVPENRTCQMAGIEDHWCACHSGKKLPIDSRDAGEATTHMMIKLNGILHSHKQCAKLSLDEKISVMEMESAEPDASKAGWREYLVVLRTSPGGGVFEGTLRNSTYGGGNASWSISGTISRLNLYGDQSRCVRDFRLKLYCYCLS